MKRRKKSSVFCDSLNTNIYAYMANSVYYSFSVVYILMMIYCMLSSNHTSYIIVNIMVIEKGKVFTSIFLPSSSMVVPKNKMLNTFSFSY